MFAEVKLQQGSTEWKEFRKKRVAASDVPIIMGVSPYKTPLDLGMEKLGLKTDDSSSYVKHLGHVFEPKIRARAELELNCGFPDVVLFKKDIPWQMASLDGYNGETKEFIEIKWVGDKVYDEILKDGPTPHHRPQLEMQFQVTGSKKGYYVPYTLDKEEKNITRYKIIPIEPGQVPRKEMLTAIESFYERVIINRELPEACDRDIFEVNNPELIALAEEYIRRKSELKDLETTVELLKDKLLKGTSYPVCKIRDIKITSYMRKGNVDYKKITGIDLEKYRKPPTLCRRITLPGEKD